MPSNADRASRKPGPSRPAHGSLVRHGNTGSLRLVELPPWAGWRWTSEAKRAERWIREYLVTPTGAGAGAPMRVAGFQRQILELIYGYLATFVSLPAANGKTTFLGAVALERLARGDDYAEIDVVATKQEQAGFLVEAAKRMVEASPELAHRCRWHVREQILEYVPTGSKLQAHPAKLSAIQGLNFSLAIIDEIGFAHDETVESLIARLGKRPDARLVGIGTPGFEPNILHRLRGASLDGELPDGVHYHEWAADPGADTFDRRAWQQANPALRAGFLTARALEVQAGLLSQREFRTYHLGIWTDSSAAWLPPGAWDALPLVGYPPDGTEVVLAVDGTFRRSLSICGCTLDGAIFHGWTSEAALDRDVADVLAGACEQWDVRAILHPKRIRPNLFRDLRDQGMPVEAWDSSPDNEATSANEFYRAITGADVQLAHDHSELIASHMASVRARYGVDGSLRLTRPDDDRFADAAIAARNAWWKALELSDERSGPTIY